MNAVLKETAMMAEAGEWIDVCGLDDIIPCTGVCALVQRRQIAVFRLKDSETVFAIDNHDPNSGANVLSRGIVGNLGEQLVVASPIFKHHFVLTTGACLENPGASVRTYPAQVVDGRVRVRVG